MAGDVGFRLDRVPGGLTLTERVYTTVKDAILTLKLAPGAALVEDDLAQQLGTSKTPVRDALLTLEREGLVNKIPYKGTYVAEVSPRDAAEIFEVRSVLEGLAARLAVNALTQAELSEMEVLLDAADEARRQGDLDAASARGADFHRAIFRRAANRRLLPILENLDDQLLRLRVLSRGPGRLERSSSQHREILAALRTGDRALAEGAMRRHLESVLHDLDLSGPDPHVGGNGKDGTS